MRPDEWRSGPLVVRFGSQGKKPKNGKMRRVPLFGVALAAAKRWLDVLPTYAVQNELGLVFPTPSGTRRPVAPKTNRWVRDARGSAPRGQGGSVSRVVAGGRDRAAGSLA